MVNSIECEIVEEVQHNDEGRFELADTIRDVSPTARAEWE